VMRKRAWRDVRERVTRVLPGLRIAYPHIGYEDVVRFCEDYHLTM